MVEVGRPRLGFLMPLKVDERPEDLEGPQADCAVDAAGDPKRLSGHPSRPDQGGYHALPGRPPRLKGDNPGPHEWRVVDGGRSISLQDHIASIEHPVRYAK